jgi:tetratricopeptide (TPR) repeat protein
MAKRVNKQFVVILGASLLGVGGAGAGAIWYMRHRQMDPALLRSQAEAAEKAGDKNAAAALWERCASAMVARRDPGADVPFIKFADLSAELSAAAKTPEEGIRHWQNSEVGLQRALSENPRNEAVQLRVMEGQYNIAQLNRSVPGWTQLETTVNKFLTSQKTKDSKPYEYRAEAILEAANQLTTELPEDRLDLAAKDIATARGLAPDSGKAAALQGQLMAFKAWRAQRRGADRTVNEIWDAYDKEMVAFLDKHPNDPDVVDEFSLTLAKRRKYARSIGLARAAYEARPDNKVIALRYASLCLLSDPGDPKNPDAERIAPRPELTEAIFKQMIAAEPQAAEGYLRLAQFYRMRRSAAPATQPGAAVASGEAAVRAALENFQACLDHISGGGGLQAFKNESYRIESYDAIASLNLDLAEGVGADTDTGKKAMRDATEYIQKLREARAPLRGIIDLLEGRMHLINHNLPQAIKSLTDAENNLSRTQGMTERLFLTRIMLATANERLQPPQLGKALDYIDSAIGTNRGAVALYLRKATILNQLKRFEEAKSVIEGVLAQKNALPPEFVAAAQVQLAQASVGLGGRGGAGADWRNLPANGQMQVANILLNQGEVRGALEIVDDVIAKGGEQPNPGALQLAIYAHLQLNERDEAIKLVEKALAKYPGNPTFDGLRAGLSRSGDSAEDTLAAINSLGDPYVKQIQLARFYGDGRNPEKELEAIHAAEALVESAGTPEATERYADVIERLFVAAAAAATHAPDEPAKARYWKIAEEAVAKAERRDLDGVKGKLYRGRLEWARSDGTRGLNLVEQAVQERSDYAFGHKVLAQMYMSVRPVPRYDQAKLELKKALDLVPNDVGLIRANVAMLMRTPTAENRAEARKLVVSGLRFAPQDRSLLALNDSVAEPLEAIKVREALHKVNPNNVENLQSLIRLYSAYRKVYPAGVLKGIELVKPMAEKPGAELPVVALLANLYAASNDVEKAIRLFDPFISNPDANVRYTGLLALGAFCASPDVSRIDDAARAFREAVKVQPEGRDFAERHLGDLYFNIQDMPNAQAVYEAILAKNPTGEARDLVVRRIIETQIRQGKFDNAERLLQKEVFERPADPVKTADGKDVPEEVRKLREQRQAEAYAQGLVLRALMRIEQNRSIDAIVDLDAALAKRPNYPDALYHRALARLSSADADLEKAAADLQQVKASSNESLGINARILLTRVLRRGHRYVEAADEFAQVLNLDPEQVGVRRDYATFLLSLCEAQRKLHTAAVDPVATGLRLLNPAVRLDALLKDSKARYSNQFLWVLMEAQLLSLQGNNYEALRRYQGIYQAVPDDPAATNYYLEALLASGNFEEAVNVATRCLGKQPDLLYIHFKRAAAFRGLKKTTEMNADLDRALDIAVNASVAAKDYTPFLQALEQAREVVPPSAADTALADRFKDRLAKRPGEVLSALGLMQVLLGNGQAADALQVLRATPMPEGDEALKALYLKEAAMVRQLAGESEGSAKAYADYLALRPNDMEALNNFACLLADTNQAQEALSYAIRAVKALELQESPVTYVVNQPNFYDTLGWAKTLNKDYNGAVADLTRSIKAQPLPVAYYHLGRTYFEMKKKADAATAVEAGLKAAREAKDPVLAQLEALDKDINRK